MTESVVISLHPYTSHTGAVERTLASVCLLYLSTVLRGFVVVGSSDKGRLQILNCVGRFTEFCESQAPNTTTQPNNNTINSMSSPVVGDTSAQYEEGGEDASGGYWYLDRRALARRTPD